MWVTMLEDEYRDCEFCGCTTNAKLRRCCDNGYLADGGKKECPHCSDMATFADGHCSKCGKPFPALLTARMRLDEKQSLVDALFAVQNGYISCRRMATRLMELHAMEAAKQADEFHRVLKQVTAVLNNFRSVAKGVLDTIDEQGKSLANDG